MDIRRAHKRLPEPKEPSRQPPEDGIQMDDIRVSRTRHRVHPTGCSCSSTSSSQGSQLSGVYASRYYASLRNAREREREQVRLSERTPKAIEAALAEARARPRRHGPFSNWSNPFGKARSFLADPVTRFWLGCNICTLLLLFSVTILFMLFLYPVLLRPIVKY